MAEKLMRSKEDRILLGVLGGIAEHLNVDPTLVRLIFVVLLVFNPVAMTLLYFLAALIIPEEGEEAEEPLADRLGNLVDETGKRLGEVFSGNENSKAIALLLIVLGAILLAGPFMPFLLPAVDFRTLLAVAFLVIGIILFSEG
ncbi:PspC domain-containing protein [Thermococcus sp. ES12]|uniref:PspC domain-containing protein n=1 Tax=Thermococcus sp. ES12 TaxID=1638246 RepID=UPI0016BB1D91|nr:PspC domain-containing protein [Thermococcus sp. ES12]NJE76322.1 PspC domain-containing protein [Thermococcus sp. ES12]